MHAVDTNVVVRLLTGDDALQTKRAAVLFKKEIIFTLQAAARMLQRIRSGDVVVP